MKDTLMIARLTLEARAAVLEHRQDYAERPERHRGCLWCEDGRISHLLTDYANFYGDETADAVWALYQRAYPRGYPGIC
jgi:hypothetical protein